MVTVVNFLESWKCGKGGVFTTFSQPLFLFFKHELPEKFTIKREEEDFKCETPLYMLVMKSFSNKLQYLK